MINEHLTQCSKFLQLLCYLCRKLPLCICTKGPSIGEKAHLEGHMRIHRGEKPCTCTVCGVKFSRDVPDIHPVPGRCRISHYSVLPGPGKIMGSSNKKKFFFT